MASSDVQFYDGSSVTTEGFEPDVVWTPFIDHDECRVGFRAKAVDADDTGTFIYFNPSGGGDGGMADVFVYSGDNNDPNEDSPEHFYCPLRQEAFTPEAGQRVLNFLREGDSASHFGFYLFTLIAKADATNKKKLHVAFPDEVEAWDFFVANGADALRAHIIRERSR
jgi:hypothetical protein